MIKKKKHPQIFYIGRQDRGYELWHSAFNSRHLEIYKELRPQDPFDLTEAEKANVIIVDVEDASYQCHETILETVLERFPNKKVVGLTEDFSPEISERLMRSKAAGYLFRECHYLNAVQCIKRIVRGKRCFINGDLELINVEREQSPVL